MKTNAHKLRPARQQAVKSSGFSLVEVMVALLVVSLGMAGVANLLVKGIQSTGIANIRSIATTHAQTSVEMMRGNLTAYMAGWYDGTNTSGATPTLIACGGTGCTATEQANNDFVTWRARLATSMPGGTGVICMDSTPDDGQPGALDCDGNGNNVTKIFWTDNRDSQTLDAGENFHRFVTVVNP
jgi:type IV pilus assembly protein PilV